jgi:hypothetical protein
MPAASSLDFGGELGVAVGDLAGPGRQGLDGVAGLHGVGADGGCGVVDLCRVGGEPVRGLPELAAERRGAGALVGELLELLRRPAR